MATPFAVDDIVRFRVTPEAQRRRQLKFPHLSASAHFRIVEVDTDNTVLVIPASTLGAYRSAWVSIEKLIRVKKAPATPAITLLDKTKPRYVAGYIRKSDYRLVIPTQDPAAHARALKRTEDHAQGPDVLRAVVLRITDTVEAHATTTYTFTTKESD